jgi:hypothetical protein
VLVATLICLAAGAVVLIPSLVWLYTVAETSGQAARHPDVQEYPAAQPPSELETTSAFVRRKQ